MPLLTLLARKCLILGAKTGAFGHIRYYVEAEAAVNTYVFNEEGLGLWENTGQTKQTYGGFVGAQLHRESKHLPFRGVWYLVIENTQTIPVAVRYHIGPYP